MIKKTKLARFVLLLALNGCAKTAYYPMGKGDDIASQAESNRGSTKWAQDVKKTANDGSCTFQVGDPKCNLFVYDMLHNTGIAPPKTGIWPITASMWTSSVPGWSVVNTQQRGDVVSNGKHCGIATDGTYTISAGTRKVYKDADISGGTVQRYNN